MEKQSISGKRKARKLALQALYQWAMSGTDLHEIELQFRIANNMEKVDDAYFCRLLHGVFAQVQEIDASFAPFLDRAVADLNPTELSTLRIGAFELLHCLEVPYKVVLDEAISLSKAFGSQDGFRYVNGVLNSLAKQTRTVEVRLNNE